MHDVAEKAGVSQMTVSRVLREDGFFSKEVKQRVLYAAQELGYIHNRLASVQRGMANPMVGVILPTLKNTVFTEVFAGINDTLNEHGLRPVFGVTEYSQDEEEKLVRDMLAWRPSGLILAGLEHSDGTRSALESADIPIAEIMDIEGDPISACFGISQNAVGVEMARHLLSRGYTNIAYLGAHGGRDKRAIKRFAAFQKEIEKGGARIVYQHVADDASSMNLGRALTADCMESGVQVDAIYYANDDLAAGGLMHCLANNIRVPSDVAIAGFNGLPFLESFPQRITTTQTPRYEVGQRAAAYVSSKDERVEGTFELDSILKIGETT